MKQSLRDSFFHDSIFCTWRAKTIKNYNTSQINYKLYHILMIFMIKLIIIA
jgi:hypothetical protein